MCESLYLGLMSGTSMDGVDALLADFSTEPPICRGFRHTPYPDTLRQSLLALTCSGPEELERYGDADVAVAHIFARAALDLLAQEKLRPANIRLIGSHGQTIRHRPERGFSVQIGDPNLIAELTGCSVVADFRRRDLAAGGQGAPLVPAFHAALWRSADANRCIVNLGGIANITWLAADMNQAVIGFDTGPANTLMDRWMERHYQLPMDRNGALARQGNVRHDLLHILLSHPYFQLPPPKSTGLERFHLDWVDQCCARCDQPLDRKDVLRTLLELSCLSCVQAIRGCGQPDQLILCGGGSLNPLMVERFAEHLPNTTISTSREFGLDPMWIEAMAFAWLARAFETHQPGNLSEVTGARGGRRLGGLYPAR